MNMRSLEIVETLLDLREDLNGKLPVLMQQFTEFPEEQIRQMAEADPTSPQRADYITWLLRLRRRNAWDGNPEPVRGLLTRFEEIKQARFTGYEGQKDINQFQSIDELAQTMEANKNAGSKKQKADTGAKKLTSGGGLTLFQMMTPEAARKFAIGKGTTDNPQTSWCTIAIETARNYIEQYGGLFVVMKGSDPYVQVCFGSPQAKDIRDHEISPAVAKEIAPVFDSPIFDKQWSTFEYRPTGWAVNDSHIEKQLLRLIKRWYNEKLEGHTHPRTGDWVPATAKTVGEARESLRAKLKSFFDLFATAVAKQDEQIIRQIGERHGAPGGLQAIYNAIYERRQPQAIQLPPLLQDYAAMEAKFNELAAKYERENYRGRQ